MIDPSMRISLTPLAEPTPTNTPAQRPSVEGAGPAKISNNPERAALKKMVYKMRNLAHSEVTLVRHPKTSDQNTVAFELSFHGKSGQLSEFKKDMYIMHQDPSHGNQSTIGYGDIDFPEQIRNKGISYLLHKALAEAAVLTGTSKVAIDNVVSEEMKHICEALGMGFGAASSFNGDPDDLIRKCSAKLASKGWNVESLQDTRTLLPSAAMTPLSQ